MIQRLQLTHEKMLIQEELKLILELEPTQELKVNLKLILNMEPTQEQKMIQKRSWIQEHKLKVEKQQWQWQT